MIDCMVNLDSHNNSYEKNTAGRAKEQAEPGKEQYRIPFPKSRQDLFSLPSAITCIYPPMRAELSTVLAMVVEKFGMQRVVLMRRGKKTSRSVHSYPPAKAPYLTAAPGSPRLYTLSCSDLHRWLVVGSCSSHPLLDLSGHGQESLLDVAGVLGGGLEEGDSEAVSEFLKADRYVSH